MLKNLAKRFVRDDQGLELSEYAIMVALIVIAVLFAIRGLSSAIGGAFNNTASTISGS